MNRFKNILFVANGSSKACPALERTVALADSNHARLTVVDVVDEISDGDSEKRFGVSLNQLVHDHHHQALVELVAPYQSKEQLIYTRVLTGTAVSEIITSVIQNGYDLVIKAMQSPANLGERLMGSTDLHLLRKCPCPVWIDRPGKTIPYKKILAAVDPMGDEGAAMRIMQLATSLAEREQAKLEVIHAWRLPGESMFLSGRSRLPQKELELLLKGEEQRYASELNGLLRNFGLSVSDPNVHFTKGNAVSRILEYGENTDLIVMATIGRSGIPGFIVGNTAEEVMQMTNASILAVKPDGYVSPLAEAPVMPNVSRSV